jgi:hypothetical protein
VDSSNTSNSDTGLRRLIHRFDQMAENTPWVRTPKKQRVLFGAIPTVVVGATMIMLGLIEKTIQAWLFAGICWVLTAAFFAGLVVRPVATGKAAIRVLAIALLALPVGYLVFVIVLLSSR